MKIGELIQDQKEVTADTLKSIEEVCYILYLKHGQQAVFDLADLLGLDDTFCKLCDIESPHINGACAVCGNVPDTSDSTT